MNSERFRLTFRATAKCLLLLLVACVIRSQAHAQEPGSAYIKNTGSSKVQIWINGSYQGYIKPGETRYTVSDGFITQDSDQPLPDGSRTTTKESHGGWENNSKDSVEITYQFPDGERKTLTVSANERGEALAGVTNKEGVTPPVPTDEERENAPAILKGSMSNLKSKDKKERPSKTSSDISNVVGSWTCCDGKGRLTIEQSGKGSYQFLRQEFPIFSTTMIDSDTVRFVVSAAPKDKLEKGLAVNYMQEATYTLKQDELIQVGDPSRLAQSFKRAQ